MLLHTDIPQGVIIASLSRSGILHTVMNFLVTQSNNDLNPATSTNIDNRQQKGSLKTGPQRTESRHRYLSIIKYQKRHTYSQQIIRSCDRQPSKSSSQNLIVNIHQPNIHFAKIHFPASTHLFSFSPMPAHYQEDVSSKPQMLTTFTKEE